MADFVRVVEVCARYARLDWVAFLGESVLKAANSSSDERKERSIAAGSFLVRVARDAGGMMSR